MVDVVVVVVVVVVLSCLCDISSRSSTVLEMSRILRLISLNFLYRIAILPLNKIVTLIKVCVNY